MAQHNSSGFGRGWMPMERDLGLPSDPDPFAHRRAGADWVKRDGGQTEYVDEEGAYHSSPLPPAGGAGGGPSSSAAFASAHPNPSRAREGLMPALPFTLERRVRFLHLLATTGNVRRACALVGVSPQSAYVHKRRDAAFAHGWDAALLLARDAAEEVLAERALEGVHETIFYRGEAVGSRTRFDARLLLAHLARLDRHHAEAGAAQGVAARFDDYLAELAAGDPLFQPAVHDAGGDPQWHPAHPTREEARLAARETALYAFPERLEDLPPAALADLDIDGVDPADLWPHALGQVQHTAEAAATAAWDAEATARLTMLDTLFETGCAETPPDPSRFAPALSERPTGGGDSPETGPARPIETKAAKPALDPVNCVNREVRPAAPIRSAASMPPFVARLSSTLHRAATNRT